MQWPLRITARRPMIPAYDPLNGPFLSDTCQGSVQQWHDNHHQWDLHQQAGDDGDRERLLHGRTQVAPADTAGQL